MPPSGGRCLVVMGRNLIKAPCVLQTSTMIQAGKVRHWPTVNSERMLPSFFSVVLGSFVLHLCLITSMLVHISVCTSPRADVAFRLEKGRLFD